MLDEQVRAALTASGQASETQLDQWQERAEAQKLPLYQVVTDEGVPEAALVSALSDLLGVPSVSLTQFGGKPELFEHVPAEVVARTRALPIGLKDRDGVQTLFVAMSDPLDVDALEEVALHTPHPIVALLAGADDLQQAIARIVPNAAPAPPPPSRGTAPAPPMSLTIDHDDDSQLELSDSSIPLAEAVAEHSANVAAVEGGSSNIFGDFGEEGLPQAQAGDMLSALSMLDDIPRDRHDVDTSPSGFYNVPGLNDSELPDLAGSGVHTMDRSDQSLPRGREPSFSLEDSRSDAGLRPPTGRHGQTGIGRPTGGPGHFGSALPPQSLRGWEDAPPADLARALVGLLLRRGLITASELAEALEEYS